MENYFPLSEQFTTQSEPSYCGPASLIMVLNAMQIDPERAWKGIWRWFHEEILKCTTKEKMLLGMTLEQMTLLARCNGLHTSTFSKTKSDYVSIYDEGLLETALKATCKIPNMYMILNFGRVELEQTGSGHFSCVGGYDP